MSAWTDAGFPNIRMANPLTAINAILSACEEIGGFTPAAQIHPLTKPYPKSGLRSILLDVDSFLLNKYANSIVNGKIWGSNTIPPHVLAAAGAYPSATLMSGDDFLYQWVRSRYIALNYLTTIALNLGTNPLVFRQYGGGGAYSSILQRADALAWKLANEDSFSESGSVSLQMWKSGTTYYGSCGNCNGRINQSVFGYSITAPLKFFAKTSVLSGTTYDSSLFGAVGSVVSWTSSPIAISGTISMETPLFIEWPYASHLSDETYSNGVALSGVWAIDITGRSYYDPQ